MNYWAHHFALVYAVIALIEVILASSEELGILNVVEVARDNTAGINKPQRVVGVRRQTGQLVS